MSDDVINACKIIGGNEWEDLRGEIVTRLLEMNLERLQGIKSIKGYMLMSCYNLGLDKKKKFKDINFVELPYQLTELAPIDHQDLLDKIEADSNNPKRFYHARVFKYCIQYKTAQNFSQASGIPYNEVRRAFNDYKKYIKQWTKR
jgi:hypothetical protein